MKTESLIARQKVYFSLFSLGISFFDGYDIRGCFIFYYFSGVFSGELNSSSIRPSLIISITVFILTILIYFRKNYPFLTLKEIQVIQSGMFIANNTSRDLFVSVQNCIMEKSLKTRQGVRNVYKIIPNGNLKSKQISKGEKAFVDIDPDVIEIKYRDTSFFEKIYFLSILIEDDRDRNLFIALSPSCAVVFSVLRGKQYKSEQCVPLGGVWKN